MKKELRRDPNNKIIAGVCSGIAKYLDIDLSLFASFWAAAYFLIRNRLSFLHSFAGFIIPEESKW